ncbi:MAG TPA: disulfide bond formation protein B [Alphaproteobacteria bacterium]|nr:disulfide bond formation protein B [Alphaproteobacteria bacterium]
MPTAAMVIAVAAILALAFVFILQYGFGVEPCILCLWQRVPYGVAIAASLVAWLWQPYSKQTQGLLALCALAFTVSTGLAIFHTGVEQHWWLGTNGCAVVPLHGASVEDLRTQLLHTVVAHCDQISWTFLGLSLANWNLPLSLALALFSFAALQRSRA